MKKQSININFILKGNIPIDDFQCKLLMNILYRTVKIHTIARHIEIERYECNIENIDE